MRIRGFADPLRFRIEVGRFTLVGPLKDQSFTCISGHTCSFDTLRVWYPQLHDHLLVVDTCSAGSDLSFSGFAQPIGLTAQSVSSAHATHQPGIASFSSEHRQVIAPGGAYRLCWNGGLPKDNPNISWIVDQRNFNVDAGRLYVIGPQPLIQARTCVSGQSCTLKALTGTAPSAEWRIMVLDTCGPSASNMTARHSTYGFANSGLAYPYVAELNVTETANLTVSAFSAVSWGNVPVSAAGGVYRLCWCTSLPWPIPHQPVQAQSNESNESHIQHGWNPTNSNESWQNWCSDASRFVLDMGSLSVIGAESTGTCVSGRRCRLGVFHPEEQGHLLVLDTCGRSSIVPGFSWATEAANSESKQISWGNTPISALGGQYRLCWCRADKNSSHPGSDLYRCSTTDDFLVDIGGLYLLGPLGPLPSARTCISGMSCSFGFELHGYEAGSDADYSDYSDSVMLLDTCGTSQGLPSQRLLRWGALGASPSIVSWETLTAPGGLYRLCWCGKLVNTSDWSNWSSTLSCDLARDHLVDAGSLLFMGPTPLSQDQTCVSGRACRVKGISAQQQHSMDKIMILATCGKFQGALPKQVIPIDGVNMYSFNASHSGSLDFGVMLAGGTYRLCWCSGMTMTGCAPADFQTDVGELTILGPFERQDRTCIAGVSCSVDAFDGLGLDLGHDRFMILSTCGFPGGSGGFGFGIRLGDVVTWESLSAPGGEYRLCWCYVFPNITFNASGGSSLSPGNESLPDCTVATDFLVDVGRLLLQDTGPLAQHCQKTVFSLNALYCSIQHSKCKSRNACWPGNCVLIEGQLWEDIL